MLSCFAAQSTFASTTPIYDLLSSRRGISQDIVKQAIEAGKLRYCNHCGKDAVAVPFLSLQGEEKVPEITALQFLSVDGQPFQFTIDKTGKGKNKVFQAGSIHSNGFFQAGIEFNKAVSDGKDIVIVEGIIDALSGSQIVPECCWLATGSTSYIKKIEHLKPFIDSIGQITLFYDNDDAGIKFVKSVYKILDNNVSGKVYAVTWQETDKQGLDVNDLLKDGQDVVKMMLDHAIEVIIPEQELDDQTESTEKPTKKPVIEFCSFADIRSQNAQPEWIIKNFLPKGEPTLISATGGVGKSMFSLYLAHTLATNKPSFYDEKNGKMLDGNLCIDLNDYLLFDEFSIIKHGQCSLFLQTENSNAQLNYRIRKIAGDNIEPLNRIFSPVINGSALASGKTFLEELKKGQTSSKKFESWFNTLINTIQDQTKQKINIVWLDPLISFCGCNENDNAEMRQNLDVLTKVSQFNDITPIVIHHNAKNSKDYRGASSIFDWTRNLISLNRIYTPEPYFDDNGKMKTRPMPSIEITHDKCNVGKMFDKLKVKMTDNFTFSRIKDDAIDPETQTEINNVVQALKDMNGYADSQNELAKQYSELTGQTKRTGDKYIKLAVEYCFINQNKKDKGYSYSLIE